MEQMFEKQAISLLANFCRAEHCDSVITMPLTFTHKMTVGKPTTNERDALLRWTGIYSRACEYHGIT
jgi:hypothetical protein